MSLETIEEFKVKLLDKIQTYIKDIKNNKVLQFCQLFLKITKVSKEIKESLSAWSR